jgi:far upstream element-binding protein
MAAPPDLNAILAALGVYLIFAATLAAVLTALLAAGRPSTTPSQTPQQPPQPPQAQYPPSQGMPPGFPGAMPTATPPAMPGYSFPPPTHSGSLDLSAIKPVSSGSVSIQDALAKARGFAAQKGLAHDARPGIPEPWSGYGVPAQTYTAPAQQEDPRLSGRPYGGQRSRSRSRSPVRREPVRESYNPYRDERRDERRGGGYGRERDRSPPRRDTFSPSQQYGRSPPANDNSEVILIDSSLVGLVIGRQGESLRRIEQESQTRIQFINGPESGPQRECRITGAPSARISAKREINRIIEENGGNPARETGRNARPAANKMVGQQQPALREGEQSSQIMVPDRTVGLIIGRGGETIRDLQERSGCHVNIVGENKSVNGLRPVNLIGSPSAAAHAKELIMEIVDSDTKQMEGSNTNQAPPPQQYNNNNRRDNFDSYGGGGGGGGAGGAGKINDSIHVPSDAVGMIIGKGKLCSGPLSFATLTNDRWRNHQVDAIRDWLQDQRIASVWC